MKSKKIFMSLFLAFIMVTFVYGEVSAASKTVYLNGSGPVYSGWIKGQGKMTIAITNNNNLNVGYDVFDTKGNVIANGTITDKYAVGRTIQSNGRSYRIRLRCQEPWWNDTKCWAKASINDVKG